MNNEFNNNQNNEYTESRADQSYTDNQTSENQAPVNEQPGYGASFYTYQTPPVTEKPPKKKRGFKGAFKLVAAAMAFGLIAGGTFQGYLALTGSGSEAAGENNKAAVQVTQTSTGDTVKPATTASGEVASDVSDVVEKVMPSIVAINSTITSTNYDFFGQAYSQEAQASGSGIIIGQNDSSLLIVTNNHVISGATDVQIVFSDESTATATVKGADANSDLAVLSVDMNFLKADTAKAIKVATLGSSDDIQAGDLAIAIGNALGYGQSVTVGYISAVNREVTINDQTMTLIQTDAAINPGNSGGALLNANGEVIGINSVKYASDEVEGMGYAIPISKAIPMINELINRETVAVADQGFLGIDASSAQNVTQVYADRFNMPIGVYVNDVIKGSPAEDAGLIQGDIITGLDGSKIETIDDLVNALSFKKAGQEVNLIVQVKENGSYVEKTLVVTLGKKN